MSESSPRRMIMPADRVPVVWGEGCDYCRRYRRACGRHEALNTYDPRQGTEYRRA
jgi:hypothetical protein